MKILNKKCGSSYQNNSMSFNIIKKIILSVILIFCFQVSHADGDIFVYLLKYMKQNGEDVVVYCGITNDPEARAFEHVQGSTMKYNTFDTMVVVAGPMSRAQALKEETRCIYQYPIPKLYQTYPGGYPDVVYPGCPYRPCDYNKEERDKRIKEYESKFDSSRLVQISNPIVVGVCSYCDTIVTYGILDYSVNNYGKVLCMDCQHQCENCGGSVTDNVLDYSRKHFDGKGLCYDCQHHQNSGSKYKSSSGSSSSSSTAQFK